MLDFMNRHSAPTARLSTKAEYYFKSSIASKAKSRSTEAEHNKTVYMTDKQTIHATTEQNAANSHLNSKRMHAL